MTQPYKVCPQCQTPAALTDPTCSRCGRQFRTQFTPPTDSANSVHAREKPRKQPFPRWAYWLFTLLITAGIVTCSGIVAVRFLSVQNERSLVTSPHQQPTVQPSVITKPVTAQTNSGFLERPSKVEKPTIIFQDTTGSACIAEFVTPDGNGFRVKVPAYGKGAIQLNPGRYEYRTYESQHYSREQDMSGAYGDAVFQRYKEYYIDLVTVTGPHRPRHIGD